jgi:hypothetical protein
VEHAAGLPELARVHWRPRATEDSLRRAGWRWTLCTAAHTVPLVATAGILAGLDLITIPVGVILLGHAWAIPELYAARGAKVARSRAPSDPPAEHVAAGLLGDLVGHQARALWHRTQLVLERGQLGIWLLGPSGAFLVRAGGRRVHCYCVGVSDASLPPSDRTAHLLLALREDESGFATVANLVFAGAPWRLRRRLPRPAREALEEARRLARG